MPKQNNGMNIDYEHRKTYGGICTMSTGGGDIY